MENSTVNFALREGYHTALMKGQHPVTFLFIEMDPAAVDVNVHPAKREVRFRDPSNVREVLVETVRRTIESGRAEWSRTFAPAPAEVQNLKPQGVDTAPSLIEPREQVALRRDWSSLPLQSQTAGSGEHRTTNIQHRTPSEPPREIQTPDSKLQNFRILGVLGKLYVLMENESGLVLVDQHAAHERILFEELRRRLEEQGVPCQRLLMPLTIQVTPRDADWIQQNLPTLQKMGIGLEPFGAGTFKIDTLPQFCTRASRWISSGM